MAGGRPSTKTKAIIATILGRISHGESLRAICRDEGMPDATTIYAWLLDDAEFSHQYARACEERADAIFEEALEIADNGSNDWMERNYGDDENSTWVLNGEHVQRSRLRIDTRKWFLAKINPRKYGEKIEVAQSGTVTHAHQINQDALDSMDPSKLAELSQAINGLLTKTKPQTVN